MGGEIPPTLKVMNKYNLLIDYKIVSDGSSVTSGNGLQTKFSNLVPGSNELTIAALIDCNIITVVVGTLPVEKVTGTPGVGEFSFNPTTGKFTFYSGLSSNSGDQVFILYTGAGVQTSTEPLTVQEVKDYLRLEGFIDDSESLSSDFDDDDTLISDLITSARVRLEEFTGLSFIPKTIEIEFTNLAGNFVIPFGPVNEITSLTYSGDDLTAITDYTTTNNLSKLKTPLFENMIMTYEAGYETLPKGLKMAMLKQIAWDYTNRGDEKTELAYDAMVQASTYKEVGTWLG